MWWKWIFVLRCQEQQLASCEVQQLENKKKTNAINWRHSSSSPQITCLILLQILWNAKEINRIQVYTDITISEMMENSEPHQLIAKAVNRAALLTEVVEALWPSMPSERPAGAWFQQTQRQESCKALRLSHLHVRNQLKWECRMDEREQKHKGISIITNLKTNRKTPITKGKEMPWRSKARLIFDIHL